MTATVESMDEFDAWCLEVIKQNFEPNIDCKCFGVCFEEGFI